MHDRNIRQNCKSIFIKTKLKLFYITFTIYIYLSFILFVYRLILSIPRVVAVAVVVEVKNMKRQTDIGFKSGNDSGSVR